MPSPCVLSIDQGTTSSRAVVFDPGTFAVLGTAQQEIEQHYPKDGWVEHEPEDIWYSVARTVREALADAGGGRTRSRPSALRTSVRPRSCGTARPAARRIAPSSGRTAGPPTSAANTPRISRGSRGKTGLVLDPYFSGTKLRWLLQNRR